MVIIVTADSVKGTKGSGIIEKFQEVQGRNVMG